MDVKTKIQKRAILRAFEAKVGRKLVGRIYEPDPLRLLGVLTSYVHSRGNIKKGTAGTPTFGAKPRNGKVAPRPAASRSDSNQQCSRVTGSTDKIPVCRRWDW